MVMCETGCMFKMRELRGAGTVTVRHIPGETNPADGSLRGALERGYQLSYGSMRRLAGSLYDRLAQE